jgi:hypothetical protein
MRVDLEAFSRSFESRAEEAIRESAELTAAVAGEDWQAVGTFVKENLFNRPSEYWNLSKLQDAYDVDRRVSLTEILRKIFQGQALKTRADLVEEQFQQFWAVSRSTVRSTKNCTNSSPPTCFTMTSGRCSTKNNLVASGPICGCPSRI